MSYSKPLRLIISLVILLLLTLGLSSVPDRADAVNSWTVVSGKRSVRLDDSCKSPTTWPAGATVILSCSGRRAKVYPNECIKTVRDGLETRSTCNYGKTAIWHGWKWGARVTVTEWAM